MNYDFKDNDIENVDNIITDINNIFQDVYDRDPVNYFKNGHCYYYATMLKNLFSDAKIMYGNGHYTTKIGNFYYDAGGINLDPSEHKDEVDDTYGPFLECIPSNKLDRERDKEIVEFLTASIKDNTEDKKIAM